MRRTKTSLHEALISLAREKPYHSIAVTEIIDRADVGRSTFYAHFRDKDELLDSGIHDLLNSVYARPRSSSLLERLVAFSLPILEHIDQHRRADGPKMAREGRIVMHERLRDVLTNLVADDLATTTRRRPSAAQIPIDLVARHVASTFVLVLNLWVDSEATLTPAEVDGRFRALVLPVLTTL